MARIGDIAARIPGAILRGDPGLRIAGATHDSRLVRPGYLFAALSGGRVDGGSFVEEAISRGAIALLVGAPVDVDVAQIVVEDTRRALGPVAAAAFGDPTEELVLVGVTGTNGKTTTCYLVEAALNANGASAGVMGTVERRLFDRRWEAGLTTPEAPVIQHVAREMLDAGATHLVMEVSSHGLALDRLGGCSFDVVAFTNLTQDHLDFHGTMEEYAAAKLALFTDIIEDAPGARAVACVDDPFGEVVARECARPVLTVSRDPEAVSDIRPAAAPEIGVDGISVEVETPAGRIGLESPLAGAHNLGNILVGLGICLQLGLDGPEALAGMAALRVIPGRLERVSSGRGPAVFVDYAHTPDALANVLRALRPLTEGRLICVFGCGGDRDRAKRPLMGRAVALGADLALVTSDNPRTEDPESIIEMILPGVREGGAAEIEAGDLARAAAGWAVEADRARAIREAIGAARPGDTVLVAGKGHEDYQILGTDRIHFDDREVARAAMEERPGGGGDG